MGGGGSAKAFLSLQPCQSVTLPSPGKGAGVFSKLFRAITPGGLPCSRAPYLCCSLLQKCNAQLGWEVIRMLLPKSNLTTQSASIPAKGVCLPDLKPMPSSKVLIVLFCSCCLMLHFVYLPVQNPAAAAQGLLPGWCSCKARKALWVT